MTMITGTRSESTVVRGVTGVKIADFHPELRYIELDDLYRLFIIHRYNYGSDYLASNLPSYQLRSHLT